MQHQSILTDKLKCETAGLIVNLIESLKEPVRCRRTRKVHKDFKHTPIWNRGE